MSSFPFCLIILVVSRCGGQSESEVEVCEYKDANLLFPNTPVGSASDIKAKTWTKEKGIRLASWMADTNFVPSPSYGGSLMAIGENGIKIRNVSRSDTGTYTLVLTSGSAPVFIEFTFHLEVLVPPTIQCIPKITQEGNTLRAVLPPDECGIPSLAPSWMSGIQTLMNGNINVLIFKSGLVPGMYAACAVGESIRCFQGSIDRFCSNYTVPALQPQNESSSVSVVGILVVIIFYIVIGVVLSLVCWKWKSIKRTLFHTSLSQWKQTSTQASAFEHAPDEENPVMVEETSTTDTSLSQWKQTSTQARAFEHTPDEENPVMVEETSTTALREIETTGDEKTPVIANAETLDKDTKLQKQLQMQQKQEHDAGSNDFEEDDKELSSQENGQQKQQVHSRKLEAKYPRFETAASRSNTYEDWPRESHMQPKELAEAGFFYQGNGDSVICFFCGGELGQWVPNDEAWAEHEKHYPLCEHVKSHKVSGSSLGRIDEIEGHQGIQSRKDSVQEERCVSNESGEKMKKETQSVQNQLLCKTCQKEKACIIFLPCSHLAACCACADKLHNCSVCLQEILYKIKAYFN